MREDRTTLIRPDHPRLFFNADTWPAVAARAEGPARRSLDRMRSRVDEAPSDPQPADWGTEAAAAAFLHRMTGDDAYARRAIDLLRVSIEFSHATRRAMRSVSWTSTTRINAWCAFDWIFDELDAQARRELGRSFLDHVETEQPGDPLLPIPEWNFSGPETGFYGNMSLLWYAGLATFGAGVDDERAGTFLQRGRDTHLEMLRHRAAAAADDGGTASVALLYAFGLYPWAEFNFLHTWEAATGQDLAAEWPHVALFANYVAWNWLPGARHFGAGDSYHDGNVIPLDHMWTHMAHVSHFYGRSFPTCAALARWILEEADRISGGAGPVGVTRAHSHRFLGGRDVFPAHECLLTRMTDTPPVGPSHLLPPARHFEHMGQTFMRSGSGPDDTYALLTAGGRVRHHRHYDNNNLVIYRGGFLALDTGSRPNPGQHMTHYYGRTVAHNCVLIHMPGEQVPAYWCEGSAPEETAAPVPNDGGQHRELGSIVVAFETSPSFTYVAADATAAYSAEKCTLALRQVVFVPPDHFVVCDRVASTDASYPKTWLLHTVGAPAIKGDSFHAEHEKGRLTCRTLAPVDARLEAIGGPGRQFWCGDRNWPLPEGFAMDGSEDTLGQWRVEVTPRGDRRDVVFLHLIDVGPSGVDASVNVAVPIQEPGWTGVSFRTADRAVRIRFATSGGAGGDIRIDPGPDGPRLKRPLTESVLPQAGIEGASPVESGA